jgi:hypothetical protein
MSKSEFKNEAGLFRWKLLREDWRLMIRSWKGLRENKKFMKDLRQGGLISENTYQNLRHGNNADEWLHLEKLRKITFYKQVAEAFVQYTSEILQISPKEIQFQGISFKGLEKETAYKRQVMAFEGKVDEAAPFTIRMNTGTAAHFEYLSFLFCTIAGEGPDLSDLIAYQKELMIAFATNAQNKDSRNILKQVSNPHEAYIVGLHHRKWWAKLSHVQARFAKDLLRVLEIFLIGHEFGHILASLNRELGRPRLYSFQKAEIFSSQFSKWQNPANESWIEEFSCDLIGFQFGLRYLKDSNLLMDHTGVYDKDMKVNNPISLITSRGEEFRHMNYIEDEVEKKGIQEKMRIDEYISMFSALKVLFWGFEMYYDKPMASHPAPADRIAFIHWDAKTANVPEYLFESNNAFDILYDCLKTGRDHPKRQHPTT